jgi:hypothetical protein
MEFEARLDNFNTKLWSYHIKVPSRIAKHFLEQGDKRVICRLNRDHTFQCAIMPAGDDVFFININKKIRDQLKLKEGQKIQVYLEKDTSTYGLPFPEELKAVLDQDPEGNRLFHQLTPGKQRNMIYGVSQVKNTDRRIQRALIMIEHLRQNGGKLDFRKLYQELKVKDAGL